MSFFQLKDGGQFPQFGLGTFLSKPGEVFDAVTFALEIGYRHFDCASIYRNQKEVGEAFAQAFKKGVVTREQLWITSKLWNDCHGKDNVEKAVDQTLQDLQLDYLDLYLIHWATPQKPGGGYYQLGEVPLSETWQAMVALKQKGKTKYAGVSNFGIKRLEQLKNDVAPIDVLQVEAHPYFPQNELFDYTQKEGIAFTAYAPLGSPTIANSRGEDLPMLLKDEVVLDIARQLEATAGQVLLAWGMARGGAVIPKSTNRRRIAENLESVQLQLPKDAIQELNSLDKGLRYFEGGFLMGDDSPYTAENIFI